MAVVCPNKSSKEFKDLEEVYGTGIAESLSVRNKGVPPSVDEAATQIKAMKIADFKRTINYLENTTSTSPKDLSDNMFRIVTKQGDNLYVVKGSALDQNASPGAEREIHQSNIKFLQSLNDAYKGLFNIERIGEGTDRESLGRDIINDVKGADFDNIYGLTYKRMAQNAESHEELLNELTQEVNADKDSQRALEDALGSDIVNKIRKYDNISKNPEKTSTINEVTFKPTRTNFKVSINQDILNDIAAKNVDNYKDSNNVDIKSTDDTNTKVQQNKTPQYSLAYDKAQVQQVNHTVLNYLKNKFNLPFEVVNDPTADWRGKFDKGKIYINAAKVNSFTPIHEYMHPFLSAIEKDNPELYNNLIDELKSTKEGQETINEIKKVYGDLGTKEQLDEALVTHISKLVTTDQIKSKPWYQKLIDWFKSFFGNSGIQISGLDMNMHIEDIANKVIDPTYSADLKNYYNFNDAATKYQKIADEEDNFLSVIDNLKNKLRLDIGIPAKNELERTRKFFSGKQLEALEKNSADYEALHDYIKSAAINAKKVSDSFDTFKTFYESRKGKLTQQERIQGFKMLDEIRSHVSLYEQSNVVIEAIKQYDPDAYEEGYSDLDKGELSFKSMAFRLNKNTKLISDWKQYSLKLIADDLYPRTKQAIDSFIKAGKKHEMPGYDEYIKVKQENPNISEEEAIEKGVKKWLQGQVQHATVDVGFADSYLSGVLNSKDAISNLIGSSLKDRFFKNADQLKRVRDSIHDILKKVRGTQIITTNAGHKEFYKPFLREINHWEKVDIDEKGNPVYGYVKRSAFHQPYKYDEFYNAKREMFQKLGERPSKTDIQAYKDWQGKKDKWFDENSIRTYNNKGEVIETKPSEKYRNFDYNKIKDTPFFKELERHYNDANDKLGEYQLRYGIIPQKSLGGGLFSDMKVSRGIKGSLSKLGENVKKQFEGEVGSYYAQDIDGREYKNVPIRHTRMVEDSDLNYNLADTVADFWESSDKYKIAKEVEPMIRTLGSYLKGDAVMKVDQRIAPEVNAKGLKKMGNYVKNLTKNKDQVNANRQLLDFVNDTLYGESEKKANIKSPFRNVQYIVYKKGDTSLNGKPHRQYVNSLEDLKKFTGTEDINQNSFIKGKEREVNGYGITMTRDDKILSVNKLTRGLNNTTAVVTLGGNAIAGISHLLRGVAYNFSEASGGKYYNHANWLSSYKEYFKNFINFNFIEDIRGGKGSKPAQLLNHYNALQGEFVNEFGHNIGSGVANKLFRRSSLFFSIHAAEHLIQTTNMIAAMKHIKIHDSIAGKDINLYDAYEKGQDGYLNIKNGVEWSDEQDNKFRDLVQSLNRERGNYSEFDKAALSRLWWGKMLIMFRRHIYNGIKARMGRKYIDYERSEAVQGYYRSFMTTMVSELNELRLNSRFRKLTPDEAYYFKKTLSDIGMIAVTAAILVPAFKQKEEHDNDTNDYLALFSRRLQMDLSFYIDPLEWKKVIQSPVVTGNTFDKIYDIFHQMAISPSEEYQKDGPGYRAGDNKAITKVKRLLPFYRDLINADPQGMLKFYNSSFLNNTK